MSARKVILPAGWTVKRVDDDKVVVMQEMTDETSTFVADTRPGVVGAVLYRLASALADQMVVDPVRDELLAALQEAVSKDLLAGAMLNDARRIIAKATGAPA